MKINNIRELREQSEFYSQLKKSNGLHWLRNYMTIEAELADPLLIFSRMVKRVFRFNVMRAAMAALGITCYYSTILWLTYSIDRSYPSLHKDPPALLQILLFVVIFVPVPLTSIAWATMTELIDAWLEVNWVTKGFKKEVTDLYNIGSGIGIEWLIGTGEETKKRKVPSHVTQSLTECMVGIAMGIKSFESGLKSRITSQRECDQEKDFLKLRYRMFVRLGAIGGNEDIRYYYQEAERRIKAKQQDDKLVHSSAAS